VDASTHAGDVAAPFGQPHGWIGNSLKYQGTGAYRIHAHTLAGDVRLHKLEAVESAHPSPGTDDFESSLKGNPQSVFRGIQQQECRPDREPVR